MRNYRFLLGGHVFMRSYQIPRSFLYYCTYTLLYILYCLRIHIRNIIFSKVECSSVFRYSSFLFYAFYFSHNTVSWWQFGGYYTHTLYSYSGIHIKGAGYRQRRDDGIGGGAVAIPFLE